MQRKTCTVICVALWQYKFETSNVQNFKNVAVALLNIVSITQPHVQHRAYSCITSNVVHRWKCNTNAMPTSVNTSNNDCMRTAPCQDSNNITRDIRSHLNYVHANVEQTTNTILALMITVTPDADFKKKSRRWHVVSSVPVIYMMISRSSLLDVLRNSVQVLCAWGVSMFQSQAALFVLVGACFSFGLLLLAARLLPLVAATTLFPCMCWCIMFATALTTLHHTESCKNYVEVDVGVCACCCVYMQL